MYCVVSKWHVETDNLDEFRRRGLAVQHELDQAPGIKNSFAFLNEAGELVAVVLYEDRAAYDRIMTDENGPFAKLVAQHRLEDVATWVSSERGDTVE